jgi:hypothetical protein
MNVPSPWLLNVNAKLNDSGLTPAFEQKTRVTPLKLF